MKISFVLFYFLIIISNYFINYYIIARYKVSSMINTKINTRTSPGRDAGSILCHSVSWSWFSQIRIEIVHTIPQMTLPSQVLCVRGM